MKQKNGLNDSDKLMVTASLWIALVSLFVTALTLPMLPNDVRNNVYSFDLETYSKYGNLFIVSASVIPVAIVLIVATLKKHGRMRHNFVSMLIFCIMMSVCMSGLTIFGITKQLIATQAEKPLDPYTTAAVAVTLFFSVLCALLPRLFHSEFFYSRKSKRSPFTEAVCNKLEKYWNFGAYGYMITGICASFVTSALAFIPIGIFIVGHLVAILVTAKIKSDKAVSPHADQHSADSPEGAAELTEDAAVSE